MVAFREFPFSTIGIHVSKVKFLFFFVGLVVFVTSPMAQRIDKGLRPKKNLGQAML